VLDPDLGAEARIEPPGQVARHHHVVGRKQGGVGPHAVGDVEAGTGQPVGRGRHPDTDDHDVGGDHRPVDQGHARHPDTVPRCLGHQPRHPHTGSHLDAVIAVQAGAHRPQLVSEHTGQGHREGFDHRDLGAEAATGGGHLGPDESGTHHGQLRALILDGRSQGDAVLEGAQGPYPPDVGRIGKRPDMGPGGHHGAVVVQKVAVIDLETVSGDIEGDGGVPEAKVEAEGVDLLRFPQTDAVESPGAGQELLRQRRPVVGRMGFGTDQDDPTGVPVGP